MMSKPGEQAGGGWLEEQALGTGDSVATQGIVGPQGAVWVDPDVVLKSRGEGLDIRHVYNSMYGPDSPLGKRWNLSLYGELLDGPGVGAPMSRRVNGGLLAWLGSGADAKRPAGCYSTLQHDYVRQTWQEQAPTGRVLVYEQYALGDWGPVEYGHIVSSTDLNNDTYYYRYDDDNRLSEVEDPSHRLLYFTYGEDGYVDSMTDWAGRTHQYDHDAYGNLISQTGPEGCVYEYTYVYGNMMESLTDPDGGTTYYTYEWNGSYWKGNSITYPNGGTRYYLFDPGMETRSVDPLGNTTYYTWDFHAHITHVADLAGRNEYHVYDEFNRHIADIDSRGNRTTFIAEDFHEPEQPTKPDWGNIAYTYDPAGTIYRDYNSGPASGNRLKLERNRLGHTTYYNYDSHWNPIQIIDPLGNSSYYTYDAYGQQVSATNRLWNTTYFGWDAYGNTTSVTNPLGETAYYQHDLAGNVIAATDPLGATSYFEYDNRDKVTKITDPLGRVSEFAYDGRGNRTIAVGACGCVTYFDYDSMSNLVRRVGPDGQAWTNQYDLMSNLTAESDPLGNTAYHTYDARQRRAATRDPRGNATYFGYDVDNNRTSVTDALGHSTYFEYDGVNRLTKTIDAKGGEWRTRYDAESHPLATTDPLNRTTYYEYTPLGQMYRVTSPGLAQTYYHYDAEGRTTAVTDPLGHTVYYLYDAAGRRTAVLDPLGNPTYYRYDAAGRQTHEIDAQGHEEVVHYNAAGQVIQRDKPSGVGAYYKYDNMGHLTEEVRYPSGDRIRYAHDVAGGTVRVEKSGVPTERWYFNAAGLVTHHRSVQPGGVSMGLPMGVNSPGFAGASGPSYDIYYEYDEAGNRTQMAFLGGGVTYFTYYDYDARNLLSSLTDPLGQTVYYERDELGREIAKRLPNAVTTYHNYDVAGQVESILHVGPAGVLQSLYYTYDGDGQRTKIEREDGTRVYFGYDAAHRLTGEDWLDPSDSHIYGFAYQYDAAGNRLRKTFNGEVTYYDYNNLNQLTTERVLGGGATYYTWTADGAMATKQEAAGWTYYIWDVDESLKRVEAPDVTLDNKYNSRMQRVWRREDGEAETLIYDGQKLIAEAVTEGLSRYYVSEGCGAVALLAWQCSSGAISYFLHDTMADVIGIIGSEGSRLSMAYDAFGLPLGAVPAGYPFLSRGGLGCYLEKPNLRHFSLLWNNPSTNCLLGNGGVGAMAKDWWRDYGGRGREAVVGIVFSRTVNGTNSCKIGCDCYKWKYNGVCRGVSTVFVGGDVELFRFHLETPHWGDSTPVFSSIKCPPDDWERSHTNLVELGYFGCSVADNPSGGEDVSCTFGLDIKDILKHIVRQPFRTILKIIPAVTFMTCDLQVIGSPEKTRCR